MAQRAAAIQQALRTLGARGLNLPGPIFERILRQPLSGGKRADYFSDGSSVSSVSSSSSSGSTSDSSDEVFVQVAHNGMKGSVRCSSGSMDSLLNRIGLGGQVHNTGASSK